MAFLDLDGLSHLVQWFKGQLGGKVDKVSGKQLSSNDYTTAEKNKLAGLSNYSHPTTSGNKHIPAGGAAGKILGWASDGTAQWVDDKDTTYGVFKGATTSADGGNGLVPAPKTANAGQYLKGDGTWGTPTNTTYGDATQSAHGLMTAADKTKLDGIAAGATSMFTRATQPRVPDCIRSRLMPAVTFRRLLLWRRRTLPGWASPRRIRPTVQLRRVQTV